jgi:hypothetical protein
MVLGKAAEFPERDSTFGTIIQAGSYNRDWSQEYFFFDKATQGFTIKS